MLWGRGEGGQWGEKRTSAILLTIKINKKKKNDYSYICLSLITNEVHVCFHGFIHLHFFYEFPVYVLSQVALVPWSCLYVNYKVGESWKEEDEATGHFNMVPHLWRRWKDWRCLEACPCWRLAVLPLPGVLLAFMPHLCKEADRSCALQALSFTGLPPACVPRMLLLISAPW